MKQPLNSLLWRIIWLHLLAVAAVAVVLPVAVRLLLNSTASSFEHQTVRRHEAAIAGALTRTASGWSLGLPPDLKAQYVAASSGFAFAIVDTQGRVLFSSLASHGPLFPPSASADHPSFYERSHGPAVYYGGSFPERRGGDIAWVQVAQDLEHPDVVVDDIVSAFLQKIAWLIPPILLLLALTDLVIVRRALRPVTKASDMARAIGPATLSIRLPTDRLPDEIAPLAHAVNQALDRLEQGFRIQREFTADAAHELRTPLSIQRARLNALPDSELRRALEADSDRMARIIGQLLDVAELDSFVPDPSEVADLQALGREVVEYMAPMALAKGRRLALTGVTRPIWVHGDGEVLFQAVRNLVENALAHAPAGSTVEVKMEAQGVLRVLDRGPGVPPAERELMFQRFWRRNRSKSGGAGLGLAIVKRIVEAHGGEVSVQGRNGGGAAFVVRLNRAGPPESGPAATFRAPVSAETEDV
ncbi:MAG TPA: HAMP domain-containing sensor histidine kinase [Caulobacteraceae bacterium]